MTARLLAILMLLSGVAANAEVAGPQLPPKAKTTPAQQAIALFKSDWDDPPPPEPCPRGKDGEVIVCGVPGRGGSPERLPLPNQRGAPAWARTPTGEIPSGTEALTRSTEKCDGFGCGGKGGLNLLMAPFVVARVIHGLFDPEWASDHADAHAPDR